MSWQIKGRIGHFALKVGQIGQKSREVITSRTRSFLNSAINLLIKNYFALNLFASLYAVLGIPIQLFLIGNNQLLNIALAMAFIIVPIGLTFPVMVKAAELNPSSFTKTLKLRDALSQLFWVLAGAVVLLWSAFFVIAVYYTNYLPSEFAIVLPAFIFSYVGVSLVEALIGGSAIGLLLSGKNRMNLRLCARTYFRVAANCVLGAEYKSKVCDFKSAIDYVNAYLRSKYNLQLLKGQGYYDYFRTVAFAGSDDEKQRLKEATIDFADKLKNEIDLNETLTATRNISGKIVCSEEDMLSEIDYEIGAKKWFTQHSKDLGLAIAVLSLLVALWRAVQH
ncbi:MAG: hypothetical protein ACBZ72_07885 [Candidatus Bathyarchaeia archaeon]|jgi:hypothetical protein